MIGRLSRRDALIIYQMRFPTSSFPAGVMAKACQVERYRPLGNHEERRVRPVGVDTKTRAAHRVGLTAGNTLHTSFLVVAPLGLWYTKSREPRICSRYVVDRDGLLNASMFPSIGARRRVSKCPAPPPSRTSVIRIP